MCKLCGSSSFVRSATSTLQVPPRRAAQDGMTDRPGGCLGTAAVSLPVSVLAPASAGTAPLERERRWKDPVTTPRAGVAGFVRRWDPLRPTGPGGRRIWKRQIPPAPRGCCLRLRAPPSRIPRPEARWLIGRAGGAGILRGARAGAAAFAVGCCCSWRTSQSQSYPSLSGSGGQQGRTARTARDGHP